MCQKFESPSLFNQHLLECPSCKTLLPPEARYCSHCGQTTLSLPNQMDRLIPASYDGTVTITT